ncbi:MAG: ZIP family metal transporter [Promethearchaeota archaeon]
MIWLGFLMILLVGLASVVGVFFLSLRERTLDRILFGFIAFSTGVILASGVLDLIPEALHHAEELAATGQNIGTQEVMAYVIVGFVAFFVMERFTIYFLLEVVQ